MIECAYCHDQTEDGWCEMCRQVTLPPERKTPTTAERIAALEALASRRDRQRQRLREALQQAHSCATLRSDGTCDGCFVSAALAEDANED